MGKAGNNFNKTSGSTTHAPTAGTITDVRLEMQEDVVETGSAKSILSGTVTYISSSNDKALQAIVGKYVHITSFLPAPKVGKMDFITLEQVTFDNIHAEPASGQLDRMTLKGVGIIPTAIKESAGMTNVMGRIHFIKEGIHNNFKLAVKEGKDIDLALIMEDMDINFTTYIPKGQLEVGRSVFLDKLVLNHSTASSVLFGHDPRKPAQVPGHPAFVENCFKAMQDVARSAGGFTSSTDAADENPGIAATGMGTPQPS